MHIHIRINTYVKGCSEPSAAGGGRAGNCRARDGQQQASWTLLYSFDSIWYYTLFILYGTILFDITGYYTFRYYMVLYSLILYGTILFRQYVVLYSLILYGTLLFRYYMVPYSFGNMWYHTL